MAIALTITTKGIDKLQNLLKVLPKNMQDEIGNATYNYAKINENNLKIQLNRTSERWRNKIFNGIKAKRLSKFRSVVKIPIEGIYLDSMKPHWVALKRGRLITKWAKDKGIKNIGYIYVKPHPFVNDALRKSRRRLTKELRKGVRKAFRKSIK